MKAKILCKIVDDEGDTYYRHAKMRSTNASLWRRPVRFAIMAGGFIDANHDEYSHRFVKRVR